MNNKAKIHRNFSKPETLRLAFWTWLTLFIITTFMENSSGSILKGSKQVDDGINLNSQNGTTPRFSSSQKCIKLWSQTHCRGKSISHLGIGRSASGCSTCRRKEMSGVLCTGPKDNQNCTKLELICNRLKPQFRETKLMEGSPIAIEKINMSTFEVYQSSLDARTSYKRPIPFIAYHRINSDISVDANTVNFKKRDKVVFYIHGYATEDLEAATRIKTALFYGARDLNYFVIVDWRKWSLRMLLFRMLNYILF